MHILMADDSIPFDGKVLREKPLGGAEKAFAYLAESLADNGHKVSVRNRCPNPGKYQGVDWQPLEADWPQEADVYIANRKHHLIDKMPHIQKRVFWIHNPAQHLGKWRYFKRLWQHRPVVVFSGKYHMNTYPWYGVGCEKVTIPYGLPQDILDEPPMTQTPGPKAVFTSSPLRSLDWLVDVWVNKVFMRLPQAQLHVYGGPGVYQNSPKAAQMEQILRHAGRYEHKGIRVRGAMPKGKLMQELKSARVMLYRGDPGETFCYALAEAQALGIPCVIQDIGSVKERILDKQTGFVARTEQEFANYAVDLMQDDELWRQQHLKALEEQRKWRWQEAAAAFEELFERL